MMALVGICVAGLAVLVLGAELLTRGAVSVAQKLRIAPIIIGITIVAVGTSAPELAVGIDAGLMGNGALAVGNIAGTNTVNLLLIFGLSALIRPLALPADTIRLDLPAIMAAGILMLVLSLDGVLSRSDGVILVLAGIIYTGMVLHSARNASRQVRSEYASECGTVADKPDQAKATLTSVAQLAVGIGLVVVAAEWFVFGAVELARLWEVSDAFIGLTVVAIGTSAPELVTTIISTIRGNRDVAIGNLLGSSIYNICIILGLTCIVPAAGLPVTQELISVDIPIMVMVAIVCAPVFLSGRQVSRLEGGIFVAAYAGYLGVLLTIRI